MRGRSLLARREHSTLTISQQHLAFPAAIPSSIALGAPFLVLGAHDVKGVDAVLLVAQHGRALVLVFVLLEKLAVGGVVVRRGYPFAGNHARKRDADAGGSVEPGRRGAVG